MAIHVLPKKDAYGNIENINSPFASKAVSGGKLFRRKHGVRKECSQGETSITFAVPYNIALIDEVEVINCTATDTVNLLVRDNELGSFSGVPNAVLNQFGFDVNLSDIYYTDTSNYDAKLYQSMIIEVTYKNNEQNTKSIGVNFVLHEVVPS